MAKRKVPQFRKPPTPCAYCGRDSSTRDHVVAQALFDKLDDHMVTVPACVFCNQRKKELDTFLRDYFALDIRTKLHPAADFNYKGRFRRAASRNQSALGGTFAGPLKRVEVITPAGLYAGEALVGGFKEPFVEQAIEYIIRGLSFYHIRSVVRPDVDFDIRLLPESEIEPVAKILMGAGGRGMFSLGNQIFNWMFWFSNENHSRWFIRFYASMQFIISVNPNPSTVTRLQ